MTQGCSQRACQRGSASPSGSRSFTREQIDKSFTTFLNIFHVAASCLSAERISAFYQKERMPEDSPPYDTHSRIIALFRFLVIYFTILQ